MRHRVTYLTNWLLVRSWLFCIHHLASSVSFGACLEVVWRQYGGLNKKHFILVHWGLNSFWYAKRCQNEFGLEQTKTGCSSFTFQLYLQVCTTNGKIIINIVWKIIEDQLPTKSPNEYRITILSTQHLNLKAQVNLRIKTMAMKLNTHLV